MKDLIDNGFVETEQRPVRALLVLHIPAPAFRFRVSGFQVPGFISGIRVSGFGVNFAFRVSGFVFRVSGCVFRIWGFMFRV